MFDNVSFDRAIRLIKPGTGSQLICFHYAGGRAEYFIPWRDGISKDTAVYAVQLPGHGSRISEPLQTCIHQLADSLVGALNILPLRPTYFFGHSMGAALAFEVALRMQQQGRKICALFVSARLPPHKNSGNDYHRRDEQQLLNKITSLGGSAIDYQAMPELKALLMPIFRADFQAIETYQRRCQQQLDCPVFACAGECDTEVSPEEMAQWQWITKGKFELKVFDGGHFYLNDQSSALFDYINSNIDALWHHSRNQ
ncbi:thioesterase II family protein [Photorhabdus temperata]|uniref:Putative thioesterase involved in non-ribosomal peptide biosynthesis n=1 Tax=Photorhabdus temperata subsp. temperata Meg1 TaxID=1393735 RepID=A0A081S0X6_PHOTE|nr:alpha/beta fold hydrolase [Photorhabdus temperata]KER04579.1 putative thioesterase involved in non-ribosomal peptide biosynthesis [Photorhabdus temperata subsp. temperata Meg1]